MLDDALIEGVDGMEAELMLLPPGFDPYHIADEDVIGTDDLAWDALLEHTAATAAAVLQPRSNLTTTQSVEQLVKRVLGKPMPGVYNHRKSVWHRVPQDTQSDPRVRSCVMIGASQSSKTLGLTNMIADMIAQSPGPSMLTYPSEKVAIQKVKKEIAPLFKESELLDSLVRDQSLKEKTDKNVNDRWTFPGGDLIVVSTASNNSTKSHPVQNIYNDEIDRTEMRSWGDPYEGINMRQNMFEPYAFTAYASTIEGTREESLILKYYDAGDQSEWFINCPSCDHEQTPDWDRNIRFDKGRTGKPQPETARYQCSREGCGHEMLDPERRQVVADSGHWKQMGTWDCACGRTVDPRKDKDAVWHFDATQDFLSQCPDCGNVRDILHRSFIWASETAYPPLSDMVDQFGRALGNPDKMKIFVNERLSRPFGDDRDMPRVKEVLENNVVDYGSAYGRFEDGTPVQVPGWVKFLVCSTDPGKDHLATVVLGIGDDDRIACIFAERVLGPVNDERTWRRVEEIRTAPYLGVDGRVYHVMKHAIDVGDGNTAGFVMQFIAPRTRAGVIPIRGDRPGPLFDRETKLRGDRNPHFVVGKLAGYRILETRMKQNPKPGGVYGDAEPGSIVFPMHYDPQTGTIVNEFAAGFDLEFMKQLTNVHLIEQYRKGKGNRLSEERVDKNTRIEAFDNMVYCLHAIEHVLKDYGVKSVNDCPLLAAQRKAVVTDAQTLVPVPLPSATEPSVAQKPVPVIPKPQKSLRQAGLRRAPTRTRIMR